MSDCETFDRSDEDLPLVDALASVTHALALSDYVVLTVSVGCIEGNSCRSCAADAADDHDGNYQDVVGAASSQDEDLSDSRGIDGHGDANASQQLIVATL